MVEEYVSHRGDPSQGEGGRVLKGPVLNDRRNTCQRESVAGRERVGTSGRWSSSPSPRRGWEGFRLVPPPTYSIHTILTTLPVMTLPLRPPPPPHHQYRDRWGTGPDRGSRIRVVGQEGGYDVDDEVGRTGSRGPVMTPSVRLVGVVPVGGVIVVTGGPLPGQGVKVSSLTLSTARSRPRTVRTQRDRGGDGTHE